MTSTAPTTGEKPKNDNDGDNTVAAPEGAVCDPITGVCRLPGASEGEGLPSLFPLPKTLRPLERLEDEKGKKVDPSVFKGKVRRANCVFPPSMGGEVIFRLYLLLPITVMYM